MRQTHSLKKNRDFRQVYARGCAASNRWLVLYVLKTGQPETRLGIAVSKKVGKSVIRSRIKRLIRESYRLMVPQPDTGYDLVVVARVAVNRLPDEDAYGEISRSLRGLLKKQKLWREDAAL